MKLSILAVLGSLVVVLATSLYAGAHRLAVRAKVPEWFTEEVHVQVNGEPYFDQLHPDGTDLTVSVPEYITDGSRRIRSLESTVTSPEVVPFSVAKQVSVFATIYGISANSTNYFLTSSGITYSLDKNFEGNNQETYAFDNPHTDKDTTSFDEDHMLQLGTDNNLRKINIPDGEQVFLGDEPSIHMGHNTFGIGYDANINTVGIGIYANGEMTFRRFDMSEFEFKDDVTFPFSAAKYGTPTGLDFITTTGGDNRFLVSTRDGDYLGFVANYVLEMSERDGIIEKIVTDGEANTLGDILYVDNNLILVNQSGSQGRVQIGAYTPHEP